MNFHRIWNLEGVAGRSALATYYRSTLVTAAASCVFMVALALSALALLFLHWPIKPVIGVATAGAVINLAAQVSRVWYAFRSGGWVASDGHTIRRTEQSGRFWRATILQLAVLLLWLAAACVIFLTFLNS